ncbi:hypothetical protein QBC43DRAFT_67078 [Cladorrhinum sp. PSN259]|nr:hypothetical protein QBC43DRAFT_67078 [Cladorrhinum sp. PSN259]
MFSDMADILTAPRAVSTTPPSTRPTVNSTLSSSSIISHKRQQQQQNHFPPSSSEILFTVQPLLYTAIGFQKLVLTTAFHLLLRTMVTAYLVGTTVAWRTLSTSKLAAVTVTQLIWQAWDSKRSRRFRKRLEFEFFVLILGPLGNMMLLLLLWPGWAMLGLGIFWGWWKYSG